ncbi:hypothetical protein GCM10010405_17370 [Streptomyces macrosporus]|uniref:Uncharacterized protein n=1 Tax=Streptomyces macrosporus TaxID=44032 RepID=A0ABN3JQ46_9ACTN
MAVHDDGLAGEAHDGIGVAAQEHRVRAVRFGCLTCAFQDVAQLGLDAASVAGRRCGHGPRPAGGSRACHAVPGGSAGISPDSRTARSRCAIDSVSMWAAQGGH